MAPRLAPVSPRCACSKLPRGLRNHKPQELRHSQGPAPYGGRERPAQTTDVAMSLFLHSSPSAPAGRMWASGSSWRTSREWRRSCHFRETKACFLAPPHTQAILCGQQGQRQPQGQRTLGKGPFPSDGPEGGSPAGALAAAVASHHGPRAVLPSTGSRACLMAGVLRRGVQWPGSTGKESGESMAPCVAGRIGHRSKASQCGKVPNTGPEDSESAVRHSLASRTSRLTEKNQIQT